ncbi:UNVERIFIED_CONTAM: hypothetical protein FKN15_019640 [Acipenser sinensis]
MQPCKQKRVRLDLMLQHFRHQIKESSLETWSVGEWQERRGHLYTIVTCQRQTFWQKLLQDGEKPNEGTDGVRNRDSRASSNHRKPDDSRDSREDEQRMARSRTKGLMVVGTETPAHRPITGSLATRATAERTSMG